ncbi:MAG: IclR family transcriptional regulator [Acidimicrobiales bacterium]
MQTVERTLVVLAAVASRSEAISLADLAESTELSLSTVHRYSSALVELGYLRRGADKRFTLGARGVALGAGAIDPEAIASRVQQVLQDLRSATGETSFASQLAGYEPICVAMERGTNPLQLSVRVGQTIPPLHAASARAILAFSEEDIVDKAFANASGVDAEPLDFKRLLEQIRNRGFDICDSEFDEGVWAVAAPVLSGRTSELFGSITVAGSQVAFASAARRDEVIQLVLAASRSLSGYS